MLISIAAAFLDFALKLFWTASLIKVIIKGNEIVLIEHVIKLKYLYIYSFML